MGFWWKQSYFCPPFGLIVFFRSNGIHQNSCGRTLGSESRRRDCSFPRSPLGSLAACLPLGAPGAAATTPGRRAWLPELRARPALYGHGVQLLCSSPWWQPTPETLCYWITSGLQAESTNVLWILAPVLFSCYRMSKPSFAASSQAGGWVAGRHQERSVSHRLSHPPRGSFQQASSQGGRWGRGWGHLSVCLGLPGQSRGAHRGTQPRPPRGGQWQPAWRPAPRWGQNRTRALRVSDECLFQCSDLLRLHLLTSCLLTDVTLGGGGRGLQAERKRDFTLLPQEWWFSGLSSAASWISKALQKMS